MPGAFIYIFLNLQIKNYYIFQTNFRVHLTLKCPIFLFPLFLSFFPPHGLPLPTSWLLSNFLLLGSSLSCSVSSLWLLLSWEHWCISLLMLVSPCFPEAFFSLFPIFHFCLHSPCLWLNAFFHCLIPCINLCWEKKKNHWRLNELWFL